MSHHQHEHGHGHSHSHSHSHSGGESEKALAGAGAVNLLWAFAQAGAGIAIGSTALLSDSVHNLGDAAGLVMAWMAARLAMRRATDYRTWGWHRAELLAGFANALLVVVGAIAVAIGAAWRLAHPTPLDGIQVSLWAVGGIAVNALSAWWISGNGQNLNSRGAFLHLVSDAMISGAVVLGGLAVHLTGRSWIDPLLALGVSIWLLRGTWPFLKETLDGLLDAVPLRHDLSRIEADLAGIEGVATVHDLHVWALGGERTALSAHLVVTENVSTSAVLERALDKLHHDHEGIHATLQVEPAEVETWHGHEVCSGRE